MIITFAGAMIVLYSLFKDEFSVGILIAGIVVLLLGICSMGYHDERLTARVNRQKWESR